MSRYITFVGRSEWAVVNSFWAILYHTDVDPDKIDVLYKESDEERAEKSVAGLEAILDERGIEAGVEKHCIEDEFELMEPAGVLEELLGDDAVLDITPARKFMASTALLEGKEHGVDAIYYLYIDSVEDAARPYLDIPLPRQDLVEMIGGDHFVDRTGR